MLLTSCQVRSVLTLFGRPQSAGFSLRVWHVPRAGEGEARHQRHPGHRCVPSATQHKSSSSLWTVPSACLSVPLTTPATGISPPPDQSPDKDAEAWVPDSEERLILREEFTSRMHQRFLDGKDGDFDYRCPVPRLPTLSRVPGPKCLHGGPRFVVLGGPRTVAGHGPSGQPQGLRSTKDQWVTLD